MFRGFDIGSRPQTAKVGGNAQEKAKKEAPPKSAKQVELPVEAGKLQAKHAPDLAKERPLFVFQLEGSTQKATGPGDIFSDGAGYH